MKTFAIAAALTAAVASPAAAGTLIVAGDATIAFRTNSGVTTGSAALAGNVTFARNLLGDGTQVRVFTATGNFNTPTQLNSAFNSFAGVTSSSLATITTQNLTGVDVFALFDPTRAITASETGALAGFLAGGGTLFLSGEAATDPFGNSFGRRGNGFLNTLLTDLGATIRLGDAALDISDQFAVGNEIAANPLTAGVLSFGYGSTTTVSGGQTLFRTNNLSTFVATEQVGAAVPEPATWAMMIGGFGLVGGAIRRRGVTNALAA